jgi:predicted RND superfamily exporter protein
VSLVDDLEKKLAFAVWRADLCIATAKSATHPIMVALYEELAAKIEKEIDALSKELREAEDVEAVISCRDYLRDTSYGRQG